MELTNKEQMFKLRDYQQEAVDAGLEYVRKKSKPGIIVAPVGSGKSLVISSLAHEIKSPTLVLQPNVELLHQNIDKLRALGGEATICSASAGERDISELTYATLGSIRNDVNLLKAKGVDTVILDEAQFGYSPDPGSMFKTFLDTLKPKNVIGFTATPFRLKQYSNMSGDRYSQLNMLNRNRPSVFKDFIHITPISKMIEESYWAELSYEEWDFDTSTLRVNSTGAEYTERSISKAISDNNVNTNILGRAKKLVEEGKRMIIFVDSVENAHKMASKLPSSVALDSGTKKSDRNKIVSDFKAGKIQAIVNVGIVGVGFDAPELDVVIIGRPTRSYALLHQWVGRAVRNPLYPKRKKALIIDFCNNIKEHGKIEDLVIQDYDGYGWGATVGEKLITGVPFGSGITLQDMIEVNKPIDVEKYTMTFGKHKGKKLTELPLGYAKWFLETIDEMNIYGWTKADKESAKAILKRQLISRKVDVPEDLSKLVIVDFNNLMFSWFSRGLLSKDGFENVMDNLKEKFRTTNVMVVKDSRRSSYWRTKLYDDYKATRKSRDTDKKFELGLKDVLDNCEIYEEEGMEADDIISREVRSGKYKEVYVVSTDSDFNQLAFFNCFYKVDYNLKTQRFSKKEAIGTLITKLLKGDAKDNIPKCHEHGRIKTSDLEDAINEVFANIVDYCRLGGCGNIASLPIKKFVQDTLEQKWTLNKEQFDLNFKLINLIQDEN